MRHPVGNQGKAAPNPIVYQTSLFRWLKTRNAPTATKGQTIIYAGDWLKDQRHGNGTEYDPAKTGFYYKGQWKNGLKSSSWVCFHYLLLYKTFAKYERDPKLEILDCDLEYLKLDPRLYPCTLCLLFVILSKIRTTFSHFLQLKRKPLFFV